MTLLRGNLTIFSHSPLRPVDRFLYATCRGVVQNLRVAKCFPVFLRLTRKESLRHRLLLDLPFTSEQSPNASELRAATTVYGNYHHEVCFLLYSSASPLSRIRARLRLLLAGTPLSEHAVARSPLRG